MKAFWKLARQVSNIAGSAWAFAAALGVVIVWGVSGPLFHFSTTWQLVINTGTTIVTFLMVFLIQNTQNRDSQAVHAKLDTLILNIGGVENELVTAEDMDDEELSELKNRLESMGKTGGVRRIDSNGAREGPANGTSKGKQRSRARRRTASSTTKERS